MNQMLCLLICFFVGVLVFYLLKKTCGCGTVVEGQTCSPTNTSGLDDQGNICALNDGKTNCVNENGCSYTPKNPADPVRLRMTFNATKIVTGNSEKSKQFIRNMRLDFGDTLQDSTQDDKWLSPGTYPDTYTDINLRGKEIPSNYITISDVQPTNFTVDIVAANDDDATSLTDFFGVQANPINQLYLTLGERFISKNITELTNVVRESLPVCDREIATQCNLGVGDSDYADSYVGAMDDDVKEAQRVIALTELCEGRYTKVGLNSYKNCGMNQNNVCVNFLTNSDCVKPAGVSSDGYGRCVCEGERCDTSTVPGQDGPYTGCDGYQIQTDCITMAEALTAHPGVDGLTCAWLPEDIPGVVTVPGTVSGDPDYTSPGGLGSTITGTCVCQGSDSDCSSFHLCGNQQTPSDCQNYSQELGNDVTDNRNISCNWSATSGAAPAPPLLGCCSA